MVSCRLATALDLARAAGLKTLELRDQSPGKVATLLAAGKLSAGRRRPISSENLLQALQTGEFPAVFQGHLCGFFEELPIDLVHDVILDETLSYSHLVLLARELGAEGETIDRFAQPRALGRKVGDEWTVPLCITHHRAVHGVGNEKQWWSDKGIDPIAHAIRLWWDTRHGRAAKMA